MSQKSCGRFQEPGLICSLRYFVHKWSTRKQAASSPAGVAQWVNPGTERSPVPFPVKAQARSVGSVPGGGHVGGSWFASLSSLFLSICPFPFLSLSLSKYQLRHIFKRVRPSLNSRRENKLVCI